MVCPKCGVEIKRFDLAPNCKNCGVHIMYYTQEEDLARDAKKCELEFAKMRVFTDKIKIGFVKDRMALLRTISLFVAAGLLFLPHAKFSVTAPFFAQDVTVSTWGAYKMFSDGILPQLLNILQADIASEFVAFFVSAIVLFVLLVLIMLGALATLVVGFLNLRKSCRVMIGFCSAAAVVCLAGIAHSFAAAAVFADSSLFSVSAGVGYFVYLALLAGMITVNVILYRHNPQPQTKPIDLERIEILKKVKSGALSLDDLPLPVCYSEEEELARTQFLGASKKKEKKVKKAKKGGEGNG